MIPRPVLATLVFSLPLLIVTFAVVCGMSSLTQAMQDEVGARTLRWVSLGVLVLAVIDILLLMCALGWQALNQGDQERFRGP